MYKSVLVVLLVLVVGCASLRDQESIVGTWGNSHDGGKTFWGYDQFSKDGTFHSWGTLPSGESFEVNGTYEVKNAEKLEHCFNVKKSSLPDIMPSGYSWCDETISVDDKHWVFKDSYGHVVTLYRQ